jgi:hypothetical protein
MKSQAKKPHRAPLLVFALLLSAAALLGQTLLLAVPAPAATPTRPVSVVSTRSDASSAPGVPDSPRAEAATPAKTSPQEPDSSAKTQNPPPKDAAMVWVNTDTGVYHKPGSRWYGKTKKGKYMLESDAIKAGYKPAKPDK